MAVVEVRYRRPDGLATIRYGIYSQSVSAGMTIRMVRSLFGLAWGIPKTAQAHMERQLLPEGYVLQPGQTINFWRV